MSETDSEKRAKSAERAVQIKQFALNTALGTFPVAGILRVQLPVKTNLKLPLSGTSHDDNTTNQSHHHGIFANQDLHFQ